MKAAKELEEDEEHSSEDDDGEIAFGKEHIKSMDRRKKKGPIPKKDKKDKAKQDKVICFECKELGHVRSECPRLKKNLKKKALKKRAMMAT